MSPEKPNKNELFTAKQDMLSRNLLVIDDDTLFCDAISSSHMVEGNFTVHIANTASSGLALCDQHKMDVVLLDQHLPDKNGSEICPEILSHNDRTKIILATAYPDLNNAVQSIKLGAFDYLAKPFNIDELCITINRAIKATELEQVAEVSSWKDRIESEQVTFVGSSMAARAVRERALIAANSQAPILLTGATGTGKTLLARYIHDNSPQRDRVFLSINCAILPENLIEAELFGVEKGAYTDAVKTRRGIFEMAAGGTLFLDEVGTLPYRLQAKLLSVLDDGLVKRLGGETARKIDTRIITATNIDLSKAVGDYTFREDLFYRLSVLAIELPTLTSRKDDIRELCTHFLGPEKTATLTNSEIQHLRSYPWPGNIRELKNILDRALLLAEGQTIKPSQFLSSNWPAQSHISNDTTQLSAPFPPKEDHSLKEMEKEHISRVLHANNFNRSQTARCLDISRSTLIRKMKLYDLC